MILYYISNTPHTKAFLDPYSKTSQETAEVNGAKTTSNGSIAQGK